MEGILMLETGIEGPRNKSFSLKRRRKVPVAYSLCEFIQKAQKILCETRWCYDMTDTICISFVFSYRD